MHLTPILYYLILAYLVTGTACYSAVTYLVYKSMTAPDEPKHTHEAPEVVLVPVGGPMGPAAPPKVH